MTKLTLDLIWELAIFGVLKFRLYQKKFRAETITSLALLYFSIKVGNSKWIYKFTWRGIFFRLTIRFQH